MTGDKKSKDWLWANIVIVIISIFYFTLIRIEKRVIDGDKKGDSGKTFTSIFNDSFFLVLITIFQVYMVLLFFKFLLFPIFSLAVYIIFGPDKIFKMDIKFILDNFFAFDILVHMITEFMFISFTLFIIIFVILLYIIFCFNTCNYDNYLVHFKIIIYVSMIIFSCIYTSYSFRRS
jgi:hypothetical protein